MKKQTLRELIEIEYDRCETISHFKQEVFRLIDLYDSDNGFFYKPKPPNPPKDRSLKEGVIPLKPKTI